MTDADTATSGSDSGAVDTGRADRGASASDSLRLRRLRERLDDTTRAARVARLAVADELRARSHRRSQWLRRALVLVLVVAAVLAVIAAVLAVDDRRSDEREALRRTVISAASAAAVRLLTADPAQPDAYVSAVLAVTTGEQHRRLVAAKAALATAVRQLPTPAGGHVLAAGLVSDPPAAGQGRADVLLAVQASNPALVGGDPDSQRLTLNFSMVDTDGRWLLERAAVA